MMPILSQKSNRWREFYNPLRGMNLPRLLSLLEAGERGEYADMQWFYHYMERSDPMIFSILQRRRAALLDSDWDIRKVTGDERQVTGDRRRVTSDGRRVTREDGSRDGVEGVEGRGEDGALGERALPGEDYGALADEQAAFLREVYDGIENFRDALAFLFLGFFRGYAHLEKHYGEGGEIERLEPVEQWFWVREGMFGEWEYNENAVSGRRRGVPIEREDFVIFGTAPLNRMLAVLYLRRNLSQKDWDSFMEVFGIPSVFLVGPPNASEAKEEEYQRIAEEMNG